MNFKKFNLMPYMVNISKNKANIKKINEKNGMEPQD